MGEYMKKNEKLNFRCYCCPGDVCNLEDKILLKGKIKFKGLTYVDEYDTLREYLHNFQTSDKTTSNPCKNGKFIPLGSAKTENRCASREEVQHAAIRNTGSLKEDNQKEFAASRNIKIVSIDKYSASGDLSRLSRESRADTLTVSSKNSRSFLSRSCSGWETIPPSSNDEQGKQSPQNNCCYYSSGKSKAPSLLSSFKSLLSSATGKSHASRTSSILSSDKSNDANPNIGLLPLEKQSNAFYDTVRYKSSDKEETSKSERSFVVWNVKKESLELFIYELDNLIVLLEEKAKQVIGDIKRLNGNEFLDLEQKFASMELYTHDFIQHIHNLKNMQKLHQTSISDMKRKELVEINDAIINCTIVKKQNIEELAKIGIN